MASFIPPSPSTYIVHLSVDLPQLLYQFNRGIRAIKVFVCVVLIWYTFIVLAGYLFRQNH